MNNLSKLKYWKSKKFIDSNFENIKVCYEDCKYVKMNPKSFISLTPGFLNLIIKHPKEWVEQNFKLEEDTNLHNETNNYLYFTVKDSSFFMDKLNLKLHVKNGVPKENEFI